MKLHLTKQQITRAILSLIFAFFLWLIANTNTNPISTPRYNGIKVEYINLASNLIIENETDTVDIKLYGTSSLIRQINKDNIKAVVDLSQFTEPGEYTIEVTILGLPDNVTVTDISDKYIKVKLVNLISEKTNYSIATSGSPSSGYTVLYIDKPSQIVTYSGSETQIEQLSHIEGNVEINGISSDITKDITLYAYDANGNKLDNVVLTPSVVNVTVVVGTTKTVPINIITTGQCASNHSLKSISLNYTTVVISGKQGVLSGISKIDTVPIDLTSASASFDTSVSLNVPNGVSLTQNHDITAHVDIEGDTSKTFSYSTLQVRNLPQNRKISFNGSVNFSVTLSGSNEAIAKLSAEDVTAYIDLTQFTDGVKDVTIQYDIPSDVYITSTSTQTVNITLSAE